MDGPIKEPLAKVMQNKLNFNFYAHSIQDEHLNSGAKILTVLYQPKEQDSKQSHCNLIPADFIFHLFQFPIHSTDLARINHVWCLSR